MYIGIDLGTTAFKGALFDKDGKLRGEFRRDYPLISRGDRVEQDANEWWRLTTQALTELGAPAANKAVKSVSISTQGISFVPVDRNGTPLHNAFSWLDTRAKQEYELLKIHFGEEKIYEKTGKPMRGPSNTLSKLMWFNRNCPELYERTYKFLLPLDFLNYKLAGKAVTDYTMASGTMLYNLRDKCWDRELLAFSGIFKEKLPDVMCMGSRIGKILPEVAAQTGLDPECEIILGGQDQKLAAIGAGLESADEACTVSIGTATAITKLTRGDLAAFKRNCIPLFVFDNKLYAAESSIATTGAAIKWLSEIIGESYFEMDAMAERSPPGANDVVFNHSLKVSGGISGLKLSTRKCDIVRALYESICHEINLGIQGLGGAKELLVFGGGAKSEILCRILAYITGLPVYVTDTVETASLGAAMLASGKKIKSAKIKESFTC